MRVQVVLTLDVAGTAPATPAANRVLTQRVAGAPPDPQREWRSTLVERPVLAGCPEQVCTACGRAWRRVKVARHLGRLAVLGELMPTCACRAGWQPGVVLDPFLGSGTTAVVAERLGRDWVGIELNPEFAQLARERVRQARVTGHEGRAA